MKYKPKPILLCLLLLFSGVITFGQPVLQKTIFVSGISSPVEITHAGDARLFVVSKRGKIWIVDESGQLNASPFLDIDPQVNSGASERGLLGLTFHPNYTNNGYFYVNYTRGDGSTVVSRFSVSVNDPNIADPNSESVLLTISQPFSNHNGGDLAFGPDGYLYIPTGDGGSGGDPSNHGQNPQSLLGKILRIDVDSGTPYAIPGSNPFVGDIIFRDEIWAYGLRNPWRFSFDRFTGDMWIGDVGQSDWEEISMQPANSPGGENYGWRCYEGLTPFNTANCPGSSTLTSPVQVYSSVFSVGESVTGGFVYRGGQYPLLQGHYVYGDYESGRIWTLYPDGIGGYNQTSQGQLMGFQQISSFGEDVNGELYVAAYSDGKIYKLEETCSAEIPSITVQGDSLIASSAASYQWYVDGMLIPGAVDSVYLPQVTGNYAVQISTQDCGNLRSASFFYSITSLDHKDLLPVVIYPNPMRQIAVLRFPNPGNDLHTLTMIDLQGKVVRQIHDISGEEMTLRREDLLPGLYLVQIDGPKHFVGKLMVK